MKVFVAMFLVLACFASLSAQTSKSLDSRRAQLRDAIQAEWEYSLRENPEFATYVGDTRYNDRLGDNSPEAVAKQTEHSRQQLKLFEAIDTTGFPDDEALNQQLMVRSLRLDIENAPFNDWQMPVSQFGGPHLGFASMSQQMPFTTVKDYENYIARLHQVPHALDQITANMKLGMANKLMPPKFLLEKVTVQAQNVADASEEKGPFTQPVQKFPPRTRNASAKKYSKSLRQKSIPPTRTSLRS
jgi:uncharacterized protein (DUF885 family)